MLGYALATMMGVILGLLGGGGSILTVPILVYFFGISASDATGYSLFIVGATSALAAVKYIKDGSADLKVAAIFAIPSTVGVLLSRKVILPLAPETMTLGGMVLSKDQLILGVFATLILVISVFMFKAKEEEKVQVRKQYSSFLKWSLIGFEGLGVGVVTGFVGAGGGFLIVPALTLLAGVPLRAAISTSLVIIAVKSLIGFAGDISYGVAFDWVFLAQFLVFTLGGVVIGTMLNKRFDVVMLRKLFAYFIVFMGVLIVVKEFLYSSL